MIGKSNVLIRVFCVFVVFATCFIGDGADAQTVKMNVFERFRNEMTVSHDAAAPKFMSPKTLAKWNAVVMPNFSKKDRYLSHFFAFSLPVPKMDKGEFYITYFNPWVDGGLLTRWKKTGEIWKIEDFYLASGERIRRQVAAQSVVSTGNIPPVWIRYKGPILRGIFSYYRYMSNNLLKKDIGEYKSWFSLDKTERANDIMRVKLRMQARIALALSNMVKDKSGPALSGAFSKLKYDILVKDKKKLASYSKHADLLIDFKPEITKTWRDNWYFKRGDTYSVILSSPIAPRLFLYMNIKTNGKIEGVLLGDLEVMAMLPPKKTVRAKPAAPLQATKKVQMYKAPNGDQIEITTEKRGDKVVMTTRRNGVVTEVLTF